MSAEDIPRHLVLLGAGYLGCRVAELARGMPRWTEVVAVTATVRRHERLHRSGARCVALDLREADGGSLATLVGAADRASVDVICLLPPSVWNAGDPAVALGALAARLRPHAGGRAVMVSSTAVYGDAGGEVVDAASPTDGVEPRARRLLAFEQAWCAAGLDAWIVRLSGLYGPGRVVGRDLVARGEALPGSADDYLNLVHVDDAAHAVLATLVAPAPLRCALISDGMAVRRGAYYAEVARRQGVRAPVFGIEGGRRVGSRRCDPRASWAALELAPRFADYRSGLADAW